MNSPMEKLRAMTLGSVQICSDDDLDLIGKFDIGNIIRSRPNPSREGLLDAWECWIEQRDLKRFHETHP